MLDTAIAEGQTVGADIVPAVSAPAKLAGIAVLGSNPTNKLHAPFHDPTWRIRACSPDNTPFGRLGPPHAAALPRVDEWCELHDPAESEDGSRPFLYLKYVSELPFVWMRDKKLMPHFRGARPYPEEEVLKRWGPFFFDTSSIAQMLAISILDCEREGIPQIGIWGVMQAMETEYKYQLPGIQYYIQRAVDLGIKIVCPQESQLYRIVRHKW